MKKLLNSLYITTDGTYLNKERETLVVKQNGEKVFQIPMHQFHNLFCFGQVMISPALMAACGENGIGIAFFSSFGRFQSRLQGPQSGNVLLRRAQYRLADRSPEKLAASFVAAKIANARQNLMKHQRNHGQSEDMESAVTQLAGALKRLKVQSDVDQIRGIEGESAARYFAVFNSLIVEDRQTEFQFKGRTKRPPLDPVNALLSFAYSLLTQEIASALQGIGIDPYVGYLHTDRPGRLSLALDMLEELRPWWCDRFVLSLINRKQIKVSDFILESSGAVRMTDDARKTFLTQWQTRKQEELEHPYTQERIPIGLLPHIQASLLAKYLREDLECYPPFLAR